VEYSDSGRGALKLLHLKLLNLKEKENKLLSRKLRSVEYNAVN